MASVGFRFGRFFLTLLLLVVLGTLCAGAVTVIQTLSYTTYLSDPVIFEVKKGASFRQISQQLAAKGLMVNPRVVEAVFRLKKQATALKAGEYSFSGLVSVDDVLQKLRDGDVIQYYVTLLEGQTLREWLAVLASHKKIKSSLTMDSLDPLRDALGQERENLEGLFFPDTYAFQEGETGLSLLVRAYEIMSNKLLQIWVERDEGLPYKNPYELLIMASIVEKETGLVEERPRIAGVFVSRLKSNMRLQTDPTVIYGLGTAFDGNLKRVHLQTANPYNTYRNKGLPPTPIAMVGTAALRAAAEPKITGELYFVSRGDGSHVFSRTLEAHNEAVRRFQLKR